MIAQKSLYLFQRFCHMGPKTALWLIYHRVKKQRFVYRWRQRWQTGASYHHWLELQKLYKLDTFEAIFQQLITHDFCDKILADPIFYHALPSSMLDSSLLRQAADNAAKRKITVLGFGTFDLSSLLNPWQHDFTNPMASPTSWQSAFYADIAIPSQQKNSITLQPEIKVPWELSRFQHLFSLGMAYQYAQKNYDTMNTLRYAKAFQEQIQSWISNNPFLQGVNWLNPMEVAIRSINMVWAFHFFKHEPTIPTSFWQRYICILYDHALFLENNWEVSDAPNNHYISNMVGYLYLSFFLLNIKKNYQTLQKVITTLLNQWKHQVLPDGTCYEGSTSYHKLVTELMLHFIMLCKHTNKPLPPWTMTTYNTMHQFLHDCTDQSGRMIQIGDNDGGIVTGGITLQAQHTTRHVITTYPNFGTSIIKTKLWHIAFRHPTYQSYQPSGHFHNDQLSITLSIDGTPILVDPGTYVYTANPVLRNQFRSIHAHNTFYLKTSKTQVSKFNDLFQLARPTCKHTTSIHETQKSIIIHDYYQCNAFPKFLAHRKLEFNIIENSLSLIDWIEGDFERLPTNDSNLIWTLNYSPYITLEQKSKFSWVIKKERCPMAAFDSTLNFFLAPSVFSPTYGAIIPTLSLFATTTTSCTAQAIAIHML